MFKPIIQNGIIFSEYIKDYDLKMYNYQIKRVLALLQKWFDIIKKVEI